MESFPQIYFFASIFQFFYAIITYMEKKVFIHEADTGCYSSVEYQLLRGAVYSGALVELLPDVLATDKAMSSMSGRANIISNVVDVPVVATGEVALWLWTGYGKLYPMSVHKTKFSKHCESLFGTIVDEPHDKTVELCHNLSVTSTRETLKDFACQCKSEKYFLHNAVRLGGIKNVIEGAVALASNDKKPDEQCIHRLKMLGAYMHSINQRKGL